MEEGEEYSEEDLKTLQEEMLEQEESSVPMPSLKDNIFKFFREILKIKDTTRVGNLKDEEIGRARKPTRQYLEVSNFAYTQGLDKLGEYYLKKAYIQSTTSMGRKGFWAQLFVTQIKKEQKIAPPQDKKTGFFSKPSGGEQNE